MTKRAGSSAWRLGLLSAATAGLYLLLTLQYPLAASLAEPRASWASMVGPTPLNLWWHVALYLGLTLLYVGLLRLLNVDDGETAGPRRFRLATIIITWAVCSAILLASAPAGESHDIYDYIFRGRMMTEYGGNPLSQVPADLPLSTPYSRYAAWYKNVDTYGPVWEGASAGVSLAVREIARDLGWWKHASPSCPNSPESCRLLTAYITGYRLWALLLTGLSGWLIYSMVKRRKPSLALPALATWLLCPATLMATAVGGHNDAVMMVLILLCLWLLLEERPFLAAMALILAVHVKLTALIWLPACGLWILRRWGWKVAWRTALASTISGLALSWLLYAPFGGWQSLPRMLQERSFIFANSWWRLGRYVLMTDWGWTSQQADRFATIGPSVLFVAGVVLISLWLLGLGPWHGQANLANDKPDDGLLWRLMLISSVLYLAVGSFWFQAWYVLWAIAPAALLPRNAFTRVVLPWMAFGALASNSASDFLAKTILQDAPPIPNIAWPVAIIWAPPLLAVVVLAVHQRVAGKFLGS